MIPVKHIDPDDLALYAMQLLPPEEMEEMSVHLQHSAEARRVLSEAYGDLSILAHSAEMHDPPVAARQRLLKQVAREKKPVPIDRTPVGAYVPRETPIVYEEPVPKSMAAKVLPWVGWALAAGMLVPAVMFYQQREQLQQTVLVQGKELNEAEGSAQAANTMMETITDPLAVHVALTSTGAAPPPEGRAVYLPEKGSLVFIASNLEKLSPSKTYELWLIPKDGHDPLPAGTFRPDERGNASVVLPLLPKGVEVAAFGVTIENGEGTSVPTMPIILKGTAG